MNIRRALADDWAAYRAIRLRALTETPWAYGSTLAREEAFPDDLWQARLATNLTFLAWDGARLVGTVTGFVDPGALVGDVQLVAMYVEPGARGSGCAHALIDALATAAATEGARRLLLDVTEMNGPAARCYRRYGFTETGRRHPLPRAPEIAEVEMVLTLAESTYG